jgi:predicted DNA-binding transcriptional regulator AlpA
VAAAAYCGISPPLFDGLVKERRMPQPLKINSRRLWDVRKIDCAIDALDDEERENPWDDM